MTLTYLERLDSWGVTWRSCYQEPYLDSCGLMKDLVISVVAQMAQQERIAISERTKAGLQRAIKAGKTLSQRVNFWSMNIAWARCSDNFHPIGRRRTLKWFLRPRSFKAVQGHRASKRHTPGSDFAAHIGGPFPCPSFFLSFRFHPTW